MQIGKEAGLTYIYPGNLPGGEYENTICPKCGAIVIERAGFHSKNRGLEGIKCAKCGVQLNFLI